MGMTPDDVAEQRAQQDEEQRIFGYGAQLEEGTSMCGGCLSPLTWDAEALGFRCTSVGCAFANFGKTGRGTN